jgi:hypothetical protein
MSDHEEDLTTDLQTSVSTTLSGQVDQTKNVPRKKKPKNLLNSAFKKTLNELGLRKPGGKEKYQEGEFIGEESDESSQSEGSPQKERQITIGDEDSTTKQKSTRVRRNNMTSGFSMATTDDDIGHIDVDEWNSLSVDWVEIKKRQEEREEIQKAKLVRGTKQPKVEEKKDDSDESEEEEEEESEEESEEEEEQFQQAAFATSQYDEHQEQFERERASMSKKFLSDINRDIEGALDENFRGKYSQRIVDFCVQDGIYCLCCNDGRVMIVNSKTGDVKTCNYFQ